MRTLSLLMIMLITITLSTPMHGSFFESVGKLATGPKKSSKGMLKKIDTELTTIDGQLNELLADIKQRKNELAQYRTEVESGNNRLRDALKTAKATTVLPTSVVTSLLASLVKQQTMLSNVNTILVTAEKMFERMTNVDAPQVHATIKKTKEVIVVCRKDAECARADASGEEKQEQPNQSSDIGQSVKKFFGF